MSVYDRLTAALTALGGGKRREPDANADGSSPPSQGPPKRASFQPWDQHAMHRRLETFRPLTWFAKPAVVGPIACASRGWINQGRDVLCCEFCRQKLVYREWLGRGGARKVVTWPVSAAAAAAATRSVPPPCHCEARPRVRA